MTTDGLSKSPTAINFPQAALATIPTRSRTSGTDSSNCRMRTRRREGVLFDKGRDLMNPLQELDKYPEAYPATADKHQRTKFQEIRDGLWTFIQSATDGEFREVSPAANEHRGVGSAARLPTRTQLHRQPSHESSPKDLIVKTLRPGYVRMSAGRKQVEQVIVKAVVHISTGPHREPAPPDPHRGSRDSHPRHPLRLCLAPPLAPPSSPLPLDPGPA